MLPARTCPASSRRGGTYRCRSTAPPRVRSPREWARTSDASWPTASSRPCHATAPSTPYRGARHVPLPAGQSDIPALACVAAWTGKPASSRRAPACSSTTCTVPTPRPPPPCIPPGRRRPAASTRRGPPPTVRRPGAGRAVDRGRAVRTARPAAGREPASRGRRFPTPAHCGPGLIEQPAGLDAMRQEFRDRTEGVSWASMIPDGTHPPLCEPPAGSLPATGQSRPEPASPRV
jgi:hypothetical protein